jgi:SAM-dependent methyltransferase
MTNTKSTQIYDTIGQGYEALRQADPRIASALTRALGDAMSVVNVGAGAGSYEPRDRHLVAVEPARTMIDQRKPDSAPVVQARAEQLPLRSNSFDAALAILTIHHWPHRRDALRELRRVAKSRVAILTWDPAAPDFWMIDYFPDLPAIDRQIFPTLEELESELGRLTVTPLPIPHDCPDGFMGAYWRRPEAYLNPEVRAAISTFAKLGDLKPGLERLERDLTSGAWLDKNAAVLAMPQLDLGYRIVTADL